MLPIIKLENARGEVLDLSANPRYYTEMTGTGPPTATVNRSKIAMADGTRYNSATVNERNLVLSITLLRDFGRARIALYKWLAAKAYVKVYYQLDDLDVWVEGYVESVEVNPYELNQTVQASIVCPYPYWQDLTETYHDATNMEKLLEFPAAFPAAGVELSTVDENDSTMIDNSGQVSSGARFEIRATIRTLQPRIYNLETGEWMGFFADLFAGDRLIINTAQGKKSVVHVRDGVQTNYINTVMPGSAWLQLGVGLNEFTYTVDEGAITLGVYHANKYQGV